jgi:hypothetical protein
MDQIPWAKFIHSFHWAAGEYVTVLGPKGYGKTTVLLELSKKRKYIVIFANKVADKTLSRFIEQNDFTVITSWDKRPYNKYKIVLWPKFEGIHSFDQQEQVFRNAISGTKKDIGIFRRGTNKDIGIFRQGGWTVAFDEILYLTGRDGIGLDREIRMMYTQGRSNEISLLGGSQRPFDVPQVMLNQADHFFYFQVVDSQEVDRISRVVGSLSNEVRAIVPRLQKYQFMYINREKRTYAISKVEK